VFPAFSTALSRGRAGARRIFAGALGALTLILGPITALTVIFARPGLKIWLGEDFAAHGYRVLQLLSIGVFINSLADVATAFIHASGRPDVSAKFHVGEFIFYLPLVCGLIRLMDIDGAALAWVIRVTVDAALLFWIALRWMPGAHPREWEMAHAGPATTSCSR